ncbi:uncharacterized protein LOC108087252 [Drosophila ficusphila]|uniref:uncharacterized protein LOC108087252 n=1 Tax=Drosophila ficusphila TaxID=30025 RepID=UPI0007E88F90|nr:uncharacterized protein LOC108087252 [Drosophila ficusphila]
MSHTCPFHSRESSAITITKSAESDDTKIAMCATLELDSCRAENWQLKKKLTEYEATIKSLEQLVATIADKQHQILSEVVELRKESRAAPTEENTAPADTSGSSSANLQEEEEDGYRPDSESENEATQSSALSARSSIASLISLCLSSTSSLGVSNIEITSDSEHELYAELGMERYSDHSEEHLEADPLAVTPPETSLTQDYPSEAESEP